MVVKCADGVRQRIFRSRFLLRFAGRRGKDREPGLWWRKSSGRNRWKHWPSLGIFVTFTSFLSSENFQIPIQEKLQKFHQSKTVILIYVSMILEVRYFTFSNGICR